MNAPTLLDYDADAKTRLWELLGLRSVSYRDQLKQSVATAGAQLEWLKPSLMGVGRDGFYAGPCVTVSPGTVLIVLAHKKKMFMLHMRPFPGHTLSAVVEETVAYAKELFGAETDKLATGGIVGVIEDLIEKLGRLPGKTGKELSSEHNHRIIGSLFASLPDELRTDTTNNIEKIVNMGICPVMIGLLGEGTVTGLCCAWPLLFPLAPYADTVVEQGDQ